ncbi:hypothetical protein B0H21DRAFT_70354 [Amylocystis lapponica]|nr:hypothetical protein B0H21DRAFT_70354 [Amylocystis lapponica]
MSRPCYVLTISSSLGGLLVWSAYGRQCTTPCEGVCCLRPLCGDMDDSDAEETFLEDAEPQPSLRLYMHLARILPVLHAVKHLNHARRFGSIVAEYRLRLSTFHRGDSHEVLLFCIRLPPSRTLLTVHDRDLPPRGPRAPRPGEYATAGVLSTIQCGTRRSSYHNEANSEWIGVSCGLHHERILAERAGRIDHLDGRRKTINASLF